MKNILLGTCCLFLLCWNVICAHAAPLVPEEYNIIIVCLDTLRADHLASYGYSRLTSPNLDKLSSDGVLFENAFSQSNLTASSHASLFTSLSVKSHKLDKVEKSLDKKHMTLATVLRNHGYKTGAFMFNAPQLDPKTGLNQGFSTYWFGKDSENEGISFEKTLPACLKWIGRHRNERFFAFLHSNDIHMPYRSKYENFFDIDYERELDKDPMTFASLGGRNGLLKTHRDIEHIIAHYDGGIKYADSYIDQLKDKLAAWGLLDNTMIIILSDHGEILADRQRRFGHGVSVHDEEVHVPLIMVGPLIRKHIRISRQVQLIDLMPTVLDWLGIERKDLKLEGQSLVELMEGRAKDDFNQYVYSASLSRSEEDFGSWCHDLMVRTLSWKLIGRTCRYKGQHSEDSKVEFELYNLNQDPEEQENIFKYCHLSITTELMDRLLGAY